MSIRVTGSQYLERTASLPTTGLTLCAWMRRRAALNNFSVFMSAGNFAGQDTISFGTDATPTNWGVVSYDATVLIERSFFASIPPQDEWFFGAMSILIAGGTDTAIGYQRLLGRNALEVAAADIGALSVTSIRCGTSVYDGTDFVDSEFYNVKCWDRILTPTEILAESFSRKVVFPEKLNWWWPLDGHDRLYDYSGNDRRPTVSGTITTAPNAPRLKDEKRKPKRLFFVAGGGGTTFQQSVGGTLTFVGTLAKQTSRSLTGSLSFSGALAKQIARSLTGAVSFAGSLTATAVFLRALTGAVSFSGALSKQTLKGLSGALSFGGALVKQTGKNLSGTLSFVGTLAKQTRRALTGAVSFSGNLLGSFTTSKALTGAISFVGTLGTLLIPFVPGSAVKAWRKVWQGLWRQVNGSDS